MAQIMGTFEKGYNSGKMSQISHIYFIQHSEEYDTSP